MSVTHSSLTCAQTPLGDRDVADAHRIAATVPNPTAHVGAHLDCADQLDAHYRGLDTDERDRLHDLHQRWAAIYTLAAALQAFAGCTWCSTDGCIATHRVSCQAEDGGEQVNVGAACIEPAARGMESSAIHRIGPVLVEELAADDYRRLGVHLHRETAPAVAAWDTAAVAGLDLGDDALDLGQFGRDSEIDVIATSIAAGGFLTDRAVDGAA